MTANSQERQHYSEILEHLKAGFPCPTSNPIMDGYFVHTLSRFLDRVDDLKSAVPILGQGQRANYGRHQESGFPEDMNSVEEITRMLADYCQGMPIWCHPNCQINVISSASIPSITAVVASALYNPNIIYDEYSARFAEAEIEAVAMLSDLVGYDPQRAAGVFTFSGTGTILYGVKLGLEKYLGGRGMQEGIRDDLKIVASSSSHYARLNVSAWLGLGMKNLVTIPSTRDNEISLTDLEDYLRRAFAAGEKVAVIIATMGTTDAFGLDDLAAIVRLRDDLAQEYNVPPPHVHADAVIGWAWSVFRDYDFEANPLGFHARTVRSLKDPLQRLGYLGLADSLGVDFHKTGFNSLHLQRLPGQGTGGFDQTFPPPRGNALSLSVRPVPSRHLHPGMLSQRQWRFVSPGQHASVRQDGLPGPDRPRGRDGRYAEGAPGSLPLHRSVK
jgi:L-2,4-diaminobutyrate decarboxylase